jgi:hypothetical protein
VLPGIEVGDIGPKVHNGYAGVDNGCAKPRDFFFTCVIGPRKLMDDSSRCIFPARPGSPVQHARAFRSSDTRRRLYNATPFEARIWWRTEKLRFELVPLAPPLTLKLDDVHSRQTGCLPRMDASPRSVWLFDKSTSRVEPLTSLATGVTIAIRYAHIRRQFGGPDGVERQIVRYPSVHMRLLPILARAYVFITIGKDMVNVFLYYP